MKVNKTFAFTPDKGVTQLLSMEVETFSMVITFSVKE